MRKYLSAICMALCFIGCSEDDETKGSFYEVTIEQSGDFRSYAKSIFLKTGGVDVKNMETGQTYIGGAGFDDASMDWETITLATIGKAVEFDIIGDVIDMEYDVQNEPIQWVMTVRKDVKEIDRKSFVFEDGKESSGDALNLHYK